MFGPGIRPELSDSIKSPGRGGGPTALPMM